MADPMLNHDIDNGSNFRLPGLVSHADNVARLITAMSFSYSGLQNPRLLECYFYAPWGQCLSHLIEDVGPETFINPQHKLAPFDRTSIQAWLKQKQKEKDDVKMFEQQRKANMLGKPWPVATPSTAPTPGPPLRVIAPADQVNVGESSATEERDDDNDDGDDDLLAEIPFETLPDQKAKEKSPDFSILKAIKFINRLTGDIITPEDFPKNPADWDIVRIAATRVLLLAELKPPASRHSKDETHFQLVLDNNLQKAGLQAIDQAELAFTADEKLDSVIALAVSGEWWMWNLVTRASVPSLELELKLIAPPSPHQQQELRKSHRLQNTEARKAEAAIQDDTEKGKVWNGMLLGVRTEPKSYEEKESALDFPSDDQKVPYQPANSKKGKEPESEEHQGPRARTVLQNAIPPYSDQAKASIFDALPPPGEWSEVMRLSTPASNQGFSILHYFIQHGRLPASGQVQPNDGHNPQDHQGAEVRANAPPSQPLSRMNRPRKS
ncbi:unnamed protein product [Cyclocybe aegerita]|uniref:Uncharacterized protein n=1 Tax=Cyclocybe aegerita TaxID=1973307 RepID=A0A8S0W5U2_CYCAE|nr:unnamed protein product [Cyclocybe aegerita]